jgi:hypothetical protein
VSSTIVWPAHGAGVLSTQFSVSVELLWKSFINKEELVYIAATVQSSLSVLRQIEEREGRLFGAAGGTCGGNFDGRKITFFLQ